MTGATAYAKATTTLPSTKPVLRVFQDAVRAAVNRVDADGKTRIFKIAEALVVKAATGDIACIREVADRLDGKAQVIGDDGAVQLSFVVRLPAQADPAEWAKTINGTFVNGADAPTTPPAITVSDDEAVPIAPVDSAEIVPIDSRSPWSEANPVRYSDTAPQPIAEPAALVPGTPSVVSDRTDG